MNELDLSTSVADWCIDHPETLAVFEQLGIDYCCGGKSLEYACSQRSLDPREVLFKLEQAIRSGQPQRPDSDRS